MGLIIEPFKSDFSEAFTQMTSFVKSLFNLQPSSSENSSGICLYPSMTTKGVFGVQFGIYGIFILDFLFLALLWPRIRAPVLALVQRSVEFLLTFQGFFGGCLITVSQSAIKSFSCRGPCT